MRERVAIIQKIGPCLTEINNMNPDAIVSLIAAIAGLGSVSAITGSLTHMVQTLFSPQERAGRSFTSIIRDAFADKPKHEQSLEERIEELSGVMAQSARLLEEITAEINIRAEFARQKKEEAEDAIAAATIHQDQLAVIQRAIRREVVQESNRGIRASIVLGIASFILGAAVSVLITLFVHPLHDSPSRSPQVIQTQVVPSHTPTASHS